MASEINVFFNGTVFSRPVEVTPSRGTLTKFQCQAINFLLIFTSKIFTQARTEKFSLLAMTFWGC